jgi:hypothetical protein
MSTRTIVIEYSPENSPAEHRTLYQYGAADEHMTEWQRLLASHAQRGAVTNLDDVSKKAASGGMAPVNLSTARDTIRTPSPIGYVTLQSVTWMED